MDFYQLLAGMPLLTYLHLGARDDYSASLPGALAHLPSLTELHLSVLVPEDSTQPLATAVLGLSRLVSLSTHSLGLAEKVLTAPVALDGRRVVLKGLTVLNLGHTIVQ